MKNYETPEFNEVKFEAIDVIQASSGTLNNNNNANTGGTGIIVPTPGSNPSSIENTY